MANSTKLCTKLDLIKRLEKYEDDDYIGLLVSVQDGRENPVHEVFIFYDAEDIFIK